MIDFKIAITGLVLGIISWIGMKVFDDMKWEGAATLCGIILTMCGLVFVMFILAWIWRL